MISYKQNSDGVAPLKKRGFENFGNLFKQLWLDLPRA